MFEDWDTAFDEEAFEPETPAELTWFDTAPTELEPAVEDEQCMVPLPIELLAPVLLWWDDEAVAILLVPPSPTPIMSSSNSEERAPPGVAGAVEAPTPELDFLI